MKKNSTDNRDPLIITFKEKCRVCYTCVRECPAKAIRISGGQAEVLNERCIGCGNCVRVCSRNAKAVRSSVRQVETLLTSGKRIAACLAPSFPAEFKPMEYLQLVGMIRKLGFYYVTEVAYGADLVAQEYKRLLKENPGKSYIATTCPAIVSFVEKYHPALVDSLAPIASPMTVTARLLKKVYGDDLQVVFIGPCIAKKSESERENVDGLVDSVLTFAELREMFTQHEVREDDVVPSEFDPPHPGKGALFAIGRGMLEAARLRENLITNDVVAADGTKDFVQALKESERGTLDAALLEVLCCNGCIMGSGMTTDASQFTRRTAISNYTRDRMESLDTREWERHNDFFRTLDLSSGFRDDDHRMAIPSSDELQQIMGKMGKSGPEDELNCQACGYETCIEHAVAIHKGLAESEMCLPFTIDKLKDTARELSSSYELLVNTKNALAQSEKLAGMGQLAAGIAHEVNNPLGVVLLYGHLLLEETPEDSEAYDDLKMIVEQAERAKKIVGGLLNFARKNKVILVETDVNDLIDRSLKAIIVPEGVEVVMEHKKEDIVAQLDADQMVQVLSNLISNAVEAMPEGKLFITTDETEEHVSVVVRDEGPGIDEDTLKRIFEPFFTTKQMGKGTGLGLAVTYGVIKMHRGSITPVSNADPACGPTGTTFTVELPKKHPDRQSSMI
ncbi:MAG: 4Fe-4S dicluster domain-containing protein [bacterium]|nr:4Fe-4S dicluster domain-containing protein [bacterium]